MKKKKGLRVLLCAAIAVAVLLAAFLIYAGSYYHADETALAVLDAPGVTQTDGTIVLTPEGACDTGLVFSPAERCRRRPICRCCSACRRPGYSACS